MLLLAVAFLPSGCASMDEASNDQINTYQTTPEKPSDDHGWGTGVSLGH